MCLIFAAMRQMLYTLLRTAVTGVSLAVLAQSCGDLLAGQEESDESRGTLQWNFASAGVIEAMTRASGEIPDTNAFLLTVKDASGKVLYDGTYGASPTSLLVSPGSYTVTARSCAFAAPAFSSPLFGDEQVIVVQKNQSARAVLNCRQLNAGMRLRVASNFLTAYPSSTLHLKSDAGSLLYGYRETRTAYFQPGPVSLVLSTSGEGDKTLYTRSLSASEILTLSVSAATSSPSGGSLSIQLDTARTWLGDSYVIGGENGGGGGTPGSSIPNAFSVPAAKENTGVEGVWVYGYIVGGDLTSSATKMNTAAPFSSDTHFAIAVRSSVTDKQECLSVELKKGDIRDALNLKTHPENLGHQVFLKGNLVEAYYGIPGLKSVTDYELR